MFFAGDSPVEFFINIPVSGIDPAISDHFERLFRDVLDEAGNEFHDRKRFFHVFIILMTVVVKRNKITIAAVDSWSGNDRTSQIPSNIVHYGLGIASIRSGIDVEAFLVFAVTGSFCLFEGGADFGFHFVKKCCTEGITEVDIVEMIHITPKTIIAESAF